MAKEGDIAVCQHGIVGVITKVKGSAVSGVLYTGHRKDDPSKPWQSKHPRVIGNIKDVLVPQKTERST